MSSELPREVIVYYEKLQNLEKLKQEVSLLKRQVSMWIQTLPDRTITIQDSKLRLTDVKKKAPLNQQHLLLRFSEFVLQQWNEVTPEDANLFAVRAVEYIMATRKESITTRLFRTNNNKNKRKLEQIIQFTPEN